MEEDYPKTQMELEQRFSDEASCRDYLFSLRWPNGFVCPSCGHPQGIRIRRDLWRCSSCRHETSVMSGTIFQDSKLPLTVWFRAMWQVSSQKNGISAMGLQRIDDAKRKTLHDFIKESIEPESTVITDGLQAYRNLTGYTHQRYVRKNQPIETGNEILPRVHRVASLLKRWLMGTHQGSVSPVHLNAYLNEFTFRFNRRASKSRGKLFYHLAQQAVQVKPVVFDSIKHKQ